MTTHCTVCRAPFPGARADLGYSTCIKCGERQARKRAHCIVPMNKSNYIVVTEPAVLAQLNPKRTQQ